MVGTPSVRWSKYTADKQKLVEEAKKKAAATTESAHAALKVAEKTKDLASNTLTQLKHQGNTMVVVDHDLHEIKADAKEAKGVLRRELGRSQMRENFQQSQASLADVPDDVILPVSEEKARQELMGQGGEFASKPQVHGEGGGLRHLHGLDDWDAEALTHEVKEQERALDKIDNVLEHLKSLGTEMGLEMSKQAPHLAALSGEVDTTQQEIASMTKGAKRNFRV